MKKLIQKMEVFMDSIVSLAKELRDLRQSYITMNGTTTNIRADMGGFITTISGLGTPIEDSRDEGVILKKENSVQLITVDGKGNKTTMYTRKSKLSKEELSLYAKYGVVLIVTL